MRFRRIGELLPGVLADLGIEVGERDIGGNPGADHREEFENGDRPKSGEEDRLGRSPMRGRRRAIGEKDGATSPASTRTLDFRGFVVTDGGRAGRTHAATGRPALPARLRLVMDGEGVHSAASAN